MAVGSFGPRRGLSRLWVLRASSGGLGEIVSKPQLTESEGDRREPEASDGSGPQRITLNALPEVWGCSVRCRTGDRNDPLGGPEQANWLSSEADLCING